MAAKQKKDRAPKAGKQPLQQGEETLRSMVYFPATIALRMQKRANGNISKYLRELVKKDLGIAS